MPRKLNTGTRVAIYARANAPEDIERQVADLTRWAHAQGVVLTNTWLDRCSSGMPAAERPGFQDCLDAIRSGAVSVEALLVTRFDRAFRDLMVGLEVLDQLRALGVELLAVEDPASLTLGFVSLGREV